MKLSSRNQVILVGALILVLIVLLVVFLVLPQFGKIADMDTRIREADARADQAEALLARRQEAKADAAGTDASLLELITAVPENPDLPSLLIELQDLAYDYNVELRSVRPQEMESETGAFQTLPIEVEVWGEWTDTVEFTQALITLPRQIRIVSTSTETLDEAEAEDAMADFDVYAVRTIVAIETYLIPAGSSVSTAPAAPTSP